MKEYSALDFSSAPRNGENGTNSRDHSGTRRPRIRDSIGITRLYILLIGVVAILTATTLLALLWAGAAIAVNQGDPGQTWGSIVSRGWAPVTVTLCAAAIRTATSLQAGVAMSMIASVLLEKYHVRLGDSILLSLVRAVSVQPVSLLLSGGRGLAKSLGVGLPFIIILSLGTLASTFTSSILLSDFGNIIILGASNTSMIGYGNDSVPTSIDVWRSPLVQYARFGEYTNGSRLAEEHIDDTGPTLRVPLLMARSDQRQSLREYKGPAVVFDDRVVCVAPRNVTLLSFNTTLSTRATQMTTLFAIGGHAVFDSGSDLPWPLRGEGSGKEVPFNCVVPRTSLAPGLTSNITVCVVRPPSSVQDRLRPLMLDSALPIANMSSYFPSIFFVFNLTAPMDERIDWDKFFSMTYSKRRTNGSTGGYEIPQDNLTVTREGFWHRTGMEGIGNLDGSTFSVSACVANNIGVPYNVTLASQFDGPEPTLGWSGGLHTELPDPLPVFSYNTTAVRRQLGATADSLNLSRQQRGVMDLNFAATDWDTPLDTGAKFYLRFEDLFPKLQTLLCTRPTNLCDTDSSALMAPDADTDVGHPAHVALFSDTLTETGSPARAIQSWLNVMTRQKVYDSLGRFEAGAEARYAYSIQVFAPRQWGGFLGVVSMLVCHLLVVLWVTVWYWRVTEHTMLGNSWQAVSQIISDATSPLLHRASDLEDADVRAIIREEMGETARYRIARLGKKDCGRRRELVAVNDSKFDT